MLGAKLLMSTSFHPQTDGATERANRSVAQIFRTSIRADQHDWLGKVPLVEFALNSSINSSMGFAPFELNYGDVRSMLFDVRPQDNVPAGVRAYGIQAMQNLFDAHDAIISARVFQTHYSNKKRRNDPEIERGSRVYLSTQNIKLPKGRASKLLPKFIGPYTVLESHPKTSTYWLDLPEGLTNRNLHDMFHVSLLHPFVPSNELLFPDRSKPKPYDFGAPQEAEEFVDEITSHSWKRNKVLFKVHWTLGDVTHEPYSTVRKLKALDNYLALVGVSQWQDLPRKTRKTG